jgi:hypothetical protein
VVRQIEELFRAKINLADLPADDVRQLIPRAQECFEYYAPMMAEVCILPLLAAAAAG